ncbi:MAG: hypothetical protein CFE21_00770 [Bacteroidetes bacterium B1(2017)]|nr:MAG: hypothetical protein CFE21_00770 [Bacteroidetes bacterium B1(2017)]
MYQFILPVHNFVRWFFLAAALYAIYRAFKGKTSGTPYSKDDKTAATLLLASAHSQLLLGLILWFYSPTVQLALANVGLAMKDKASRLILLEHPLLMIIAVAIIQIGKIKVKKAYADSDKHQRSLVYYGIGLILVLSRIPWSSTPLFRF